MRHYSILEYGRFRWLKAGLALAAAASLLYLWHQPEVRPYGGTWLGYGLGTLGGILILWLLWYGVRKRSYRSTTGTVEGWLSAHVYLGTALVAVVTLHTGFQVGWNIHTLAFVLVLLVVGSGFCGVWLYLHVPEAITTNLGEDTFESLVLRIADIDREMHGNAISLPDDIYSLVERSITHTRLGAGARHLVAGTDRACPTVAAVREWPARARRLTGDVAKLDKEVFALMLRKQELLARARRHLRHQALLDLWLYAHVPLAFALLAALIAHVVSVFIYW